jgi:protein XagA
LGLRQKLWSTGEWVFSGEATAFIPGGHDSHAPAQEGNTGWAGEARLNAGRNFTLASIPGFGWFPGLGAVPGFLDAEVAYRLRTQGPPDEWHGDLTVGFKFTPQILLMLQEFTTVSMSTDNRSFPAWRQSVVEASVVYALNNKWSLQLGLFSTVWTVRTNSERGGTIAVWRNF